jgi:flagellin-like protein
MKIANLFEQDENAVSPVIGVILMVSITVILAAVIGTFVLGLGENLQQTSPNTNFDFDYTAGNDATVDITHTGGDSIDADKNTLKVVDEAGNSVEFTDSSVSAGDSITFNNVDSGETIRVIWESQTGDNSATLAESESP